MATLIGQSHHQHWGYSSYNFVQRFGRLLQSFGTQLERYTQLAEQRQQLLEMDDHMLNDIGIKRGDLRRLTGFRWFLMR